MKRYSIRSYVCTIFICDLMSKSLNGLGAGVLEQSISGGSCRGQGNSHDTSIEFSRGTLSDSIRVFDSDASSSEGSAHTIVWYSAVGRKSHSRSQESNSSDKSGRELHFEFDLI